ncbi:MAG: FeoA family protein [Anaerovoracaceae bacterium]
MKLNKLKPGEKGIITIVGGQGALRRRLLDLGLTPKTEITVRKVAPFGGPIEIFLRGFELTIRKEEAAKVEVEVVSQ